MNKIGLNVHAERIDGDLELLKRDLEAIESAGFDVAEIPVSGVDAVVNGHLREGRTKRVKSILDQFDLEYTVHAPNNLNLRDFRYQEIQRRLFSSCIRFTAKIGVKKLVYHQGRLIRDGEAITEEEAREIEIEGLTDLGRLAEEEGVIICIENVHSSITHLIRLIQNVGLKSVGICYDFAHSFINARRIGYDYLRSIQLAKPYIYHTHIHDNFGKGEVETEIPYIEGMPLGIGDLHLPVGWGSIPYEKVFKAIEGYEGIYIIELKQRFFEDGYTIIEEALKNLKDVLEKIKIR
jgi:sugar phosphate isomerase/epimerase